jgi:CRP/FNR family transcriptional regulator, cyclic AMP receptor protein
MLNADWLGWAASALVLATFCMRGMVALRLTAIASNLAFIAYGASAGIDPVLMLHVLLLPLNALRLAQERGQLPRLHTQENA